MSMCFSFTSQGYSSVNLLSNLFIHWSYALDNVYLRNSLPYLQDNLKLMDDLAALRPTLFCSVPRLYNRIYAGYVAVKCHMLHK